MIFWLSLQVYYKMNDFPYLAFRFPITNQSLISEKKSEGTYGAW